MPLDESPSDEESDGEDRSVLFRAAAEPDATWAYGPADAQSADLYLPPGGAAGAVPVVLVHGGFWRPEYDRVHLRPLARALADAGHAALSIDYRRIPGEPDTTVADLRLALDRLASDPPQGWPAGPATLVGHSAGGHLVLLAAAQAGPVIGHVIALAPVADLRMAQASRLDGDAVPAFLGASADDRPDLDPARCPPAVPVTAIHGTRDSLVPLALSESYAAAAASDVRLVALPGTGHFELIDPNTDAFRQLLSVLAATGIE